MKIRIWCKKHQRAHSQHEAYHCATWGCPRTDRDPNAVACPNQWKHPSGEQE